MSRKRSRVAVFVAGGAIATAALEALAEAHRVVGVLRLQSRPGIRGSVRAGVGRIARRARLIASDPIGDWARARGVPTLTMSHGDDPLAARRLSELRVDYGCIATFPGRIGNRVLDATGDVCINLHPSLLPRHRGPNPLFWTYYEADPIGGVTVHVATAELDGGPILSSESCAIARGQPVGELHDRYAALGGRLAVAAIDALAEGSASPRAQDQSAATAAPRVEPGRVYSRLDEWSTERAWHFLAGMAGQHQEPFEDERGRVVRYSRVVGFETTPPRAAPGSVTTTRSGWSAWATDGVVHLAR